KPINQNSPRQILRHPRANMDKENQPEMAERKHAGDPGRFLARPISLASYPVATGRPLPGPRAGGRVIEEVNAGTPALFGATHLVGELPRSNGQTTAWP